MLFLYRRHRIAGANAAAGDYLGIDPAIVMAETVEPRSQYAMVCLLLSHVPRYWM